MNTTERLLNATSDIWTRYNEHPFVLGIENGTLNKDKFRYYIIQDFIYLQDYLRTFAIGIAKAKTIEARDIFSGYISLLTGSEMSIHKGYMGVFNVSEEEYKATPTALDNLSYTSYMIRVAYDEGEAEILAAVLSCAYSYEIIAKKMIERNPKTTEDSFYGDWINGYASNEYSNGNVKLINTLNMLTKDYNEVQLKHLEDIFVACSRYEEKFWDFSWNMSK